MSTAELLESGRLFIYLLFIYYLFIMKIVHNSCQLHFSMGLVATFC